MTNPQVEYQLLRPAQLRARRAELPVAYLGLGILEWHGLHNPLGLDGVKANAIAVHLARQLGGVVLPPLFWGDNREEICELVFDPAVSPWLPPGTGDHTGAIMAALGAEKAAFAADAARSRANGGWRLWEELLVHILFQAQTLGFRLIVLLPGHYPLFSPLRRALDSYREQGGALQTFTLTDTMYSETGDSGDHAAAFETSLMLALAPQLVDLGALDPDPAVPPAGVLGQDPRAHATPEFGAQILRKMTALTRQEIERVKGIW